MDLLMESIEESEGEEVLLCALAAKPLHSRPSARSVIEMSEFSIDEVEGEVVIHSPGKRRARTGGSSVPRPLPACVMLWTALRFAVQVSALTHPSGSTGFSFHSLLLPLLVVGAVLAPGRVPGLARAVALMARGLSQPASSGRLPGLGPLLDVSLMLALGGAAARRIGRAAAGTRPVRHSPRHDWRSLVSIPGPEEELAVLAAATGLAATGWACGAALALLRPS
jgi:hypothetical protein